MGVSNAWGLGLTYMHATSRASLRSSVIVNVDKRVN